MSTSIAWMHDLHDASAAHEASVVELARTLDDPVRVVHALGVSMDTRPTESAASDSSHRVLETRRAQATETLAPVVDRLTAAGVTAQIELLEGRPLAAAKSAYETQNFRIAVAGRSGAKGLDRLIMGSETTRLIRECPASVLVLGGRTFHTLERIAVAIDPDDCQGKELQLAAEIGHASQAQLSVISVLEMGLEDTTPARVEDTIREAVPRLSPLALPKGWTAKCVVAETVLSGLERAAASVDLLIIGSRRRSGWQRVVLGSVAEALSRTCPVPVLVAR